MTGGGWVGGCVEGRTYPSDGQDDEAFLLERVEEGFATEGAEEAPEEEGDAWGVGWVGGWVGGSVERRERGYGR